MVWGKFQKVDNVFGALLSDSRSPYGLAVINDTGLDAHNNGNASPWHCMDLDHDLQGAGFQGDESADLSSDYDSIPCWRCLLRHSFNGWQHLTFKKTFGKQEWEYGRSNRYSSSFHHLQSSKSTLPSCRACYHQSQMQPLAMSIRQRTQLQDMPTPRQTWPRAIATKLTDT